MVESVVINCLIIFFARIADVSLGTLRTLSMVRGDTVRSWFLGFFEVLIWIAVISQIIDSVRDTPLYALFYASGFATGTAVGIKIERRLAIGERVVMLFTRKGEQIAKHLRQNGFPVTEFEARGQEGKISHLFIKTQRKDVQGVVAMANELDPDCFVVVEQVETLSRINPVLSPRTGWRTQGRKFK
ncbi:MAG: DUF5698 domain-containing protein [Proteobacteria bacterium]|nr:DUF5698 domain-containing protein [Pseudomonadota bacterium]